MSIDVMRDGKVVPLRVVDPPMVGGMPWAVAESGERTKAGLLGPLSMRERGLVCAVAEALGAFRGAVESDGLGPQERQGLLSLLVAFKDATGCAWTEAEWA